MNDNNIYHPKIKETEVKDSFDPISILPIEDKKNLLAESEESLSGHCDKVAIDIEREQALYPDADKGKELQNYLNTTCFFKDKLDPHILVCIHAILLCNEIKKQRATYLYRWIKAKPNDFTLPHWELIYPELSELILNFLAANQKLKKPMHFKCEEYDLVIATFNQVLGTDHTHLFDSIKYPHTEVNVVDASGNIKEIKSFIAVCSNQIIKGILKGLKAPKFMQRVNDRRKVAKRGENKVQKYVDKLRGLYSRLLGVRVDLYLPADKKHFTPQQIVKHFHTILQKLRRSKSLHLKGYVSKMEYGVDQALHIHCFFFFCGRKHREDISLGRMIGELWDSQIGGKHSYFNCNTSKNRKKYKYDALGVIDRDDQTKYDNIAKVIRYLAKFEQYVLHSSLERVKTLNTGLLPHIKKGMGRPNLTQYYKSI